VSELDLAVVAKDGELRFEVHAKPRAKRTSIVGVRSQETLKTVPITFVLFDPSPTRCASRAGRRTSRRARS
jgi:hypothetical protein